MPSRKKNLGFTLIEIVVGVLVVGFAMTALVITIYSSANKSHEATYQAQAAALGHSIMTDILSRQFDENSDPNGGFYRCGENDVDGNLRPCSSVLKREESATTHADLFNDVDDFIGCWGSNADCNSLASTATRYPLNKLIDESSADEYHNFTVIINVAYDLPAGSTLFKRIDLTVNGGQHAQYTFSAFRGNY